MRQKHFVAAAATAGLLAIGPLSGFATAAEASPGVGTTNVSSSLLSVQLGTNGDLLSVRVLGDDGTANTDPAKGATSGAESLSPLTITSAAVPALNLSVPPVSVSSTGAEDKKEVTPALPSIPAFDGDLQAVLSSVVDTEGAKSGLSAGLANVGVAGGLLSMPSALSGVSSNAITTSATGSRSVTIDSIEVLNLAAVLNGLGTTLSALPVGDLLALLGSLGVTVPNVSDPAAVVTALNGAIDLLQGAAGNVTSELCNTLDGLIGGVDVPEVPVTTPTTVKVPDLPVDPGLGILGITCDTTQTVNDVLDQVQAELGNLLGTILSLLADTPLLSVHNVQIGLVAKAAGTVQDSVADVTATIGSVNVGSLGVPGVSGLDLTAAADVINGATEAIQSQIGGVLGQINAGLANLVDVDVLAIAENVSAANGYTSATSSITALKATITPPAELSAIISTINSAVAPVSSVLGDLGATVPAVGTVMTQLEGVLGGVQALSGPSVISAGSLSAASTFKPANGITSAPDGELPRTGRNAALPAMVAVFLAAAAVAVRRVVRIATADS